LVVWDDIAIKTATTYEMENLLSIIDYRLNSGKSNIYTSNLFGSELSQRLGERLYSRIINLSEIIEFSG
jgi:DNA replication protein DnaC